MEAPLSELLLSGLKLMLIGMSIVFLFLALQVSIITVTAKLVQRYGPEPEAPPVRGGAGAAADEAELVAVMAAAIHRYRTSEP